MVVSRVDAFGQSGWLVEEMLARYLDSPESVSREWRRFFEERGAARLGSPQPAPGGAEDAVLRLPSPAAGSPAAPPAPGTGTGAPRGLPAGPSDLASADPSEEASPMRGVVATIARRMDESLSVPTATSFREVPAKLLEVNRTIINNQLRRSGRTGKVSFTHLIGWAVVRALAELRALNVSYSLIDGVPHLVTHPHVNLGLAIDHERPDGTRILLVPSIKAAESGDFRRFWESYEDLVRRTRANKLSPDDLLGTTVSLTNPGTIGTVQSVPRLMADQGVIIGVGAIGFPPEFQAADPEFLARQGIGRVVTLSSTYDHRVIQGAQSGELLRTIHDLLLGGDGFYDAVFESLDVPYTPARWAVDDNPPVGSAGWAEKQAEVFRLINAYRVRGHLIADLDPLRQAKPAMHAELDPLHYGLSIWDLAREFATGGVGGEDVLSLERILSVLRDAYCRTTGIEYMHIQETAQKTWIQDRVELPAPSPNHDERIRILDRLNRAEAFEAFLHTKYLGHKRFGIEGSESLIPLLDGVLDAAVADGVEEAVIGMSHRGRLNVLATIIGKDLGRIFREFEGNVDPDVPGGSGDVKYHLGATGIYATPAGPILLEVVANPSHLEAVDPVLEGVARAKQDRRGADSARRVLPILLHGDAAFAGQGVVAETLNLSQLPGYATGGTVHVVINNQVGFTTSTLEARSSVYATDIAKAVQAPIFHVNGDDPEAVVRSARRAFEFRQRFAKDVVIDLICYRRRGHNEADEPSYTQPLMYKLIDSHRSVRQLYLDRLVALGAITAEEGEEMVIEYRTLLDAAFHETRSIVSVPGREPGSTHASTVEPATAVPRAELEDILSHLTAPPADFVVHPKLERLMTERSETFSSGVVDWATAEALAFGSLARHGVPVRLAGEDSRRGTFSHRHAELTDYETAVRWAPLATIGTESVEIVDSLLSEMAAVGFEYGYSVERTEALVLWEAQFGDFANGAQVIIDQFIASGEAKWGQASRLTLLLPHGLEGQGPEHSSGRIERFLDLCADDNLRVVVPATSGQYFHLLRRQALHPQRKPLVVLTPKSLLRNRQSFSPVGALEEGRFEPLVEDPVTPVGARRLILCAGKVYHDLAARKAATGADDVALVRIAQLYPVPSEGLADLAGRHPAADVVWCQEEPENMGAYRFFGGHLRRIFGKDLRYVGRPESPSPASGSLTVHAAEQAALVAAAMG